MPWPGRKTKLTSELQAKFVSARRAGNWVLTCCDYVGIHPDTYYGWMERAREGGPRNKIYVDFAAAVQSASATAEVESVARIRLAGSKGNIRADMWFLERSYPERWGKRRLELTGKDGEPLNPAASPTVTENSSYDEVLTAYREMIKE